MSKLKNPTGSPARGWARENTAGLRYGENDKKRTTDCVSEGQSETRQAKRNACHFLKKGIRLHGDCRDCNARKLRYDYCVVLVRTQEE